MILRGKDERAAPHVLICLCSIWAYAAAVTTRMLLTFWLVEAVAALKGERTLGAYLGADKMYDDDFPQRSG